MSSCAGEIGQEAPDEGALLFGARFLMYKRGIHPVFPGTCMKIHYEAQLGLRKVEEYSGSDDVYLSWTL